MIFAVFVRCGCVKDWKSHTESQNEDNDDAGNEGAEDDDTEGTDDAEDEDWGC